MTKLIVYFSLLPKRSGGNLSLLISVTGSDTVVVTEVTLFDSSGPTEVNGSLQACHMLFINIQNPAH